ncbi:PAS domain-containing protein [Halovenus rubra]|uniref:histidine kinase n=2 Tax=Halovenus rubra TaxID=869890 RepID=A0ABD5X3I9_9EURY|nr:PAS domain-containing protein [Halovenus rubra]
MGEEQSGDKGQQIEATLARQVYRSLETAVVVYDAKADAILDCNDAACELFELSPVGLTGCSITELASRLSPGTQTDARTSVQEAATGNPQKTEWIIEDSSGNHRPTAVTLSPLPSDNNQYVGIELTNLSDQIFKKAQTQTDLLDRVNDAFFALDRDQRFTYLNDRGLEIICEAIGETLTVEELQGRPLVEEIPDITGTTFHEKYKQALSSGETVSFEEYYEHLDNWFEVTAYPSESGLSVFFNDITNKRRATTELEETIEVLHDLYVLGSDNDLSFERRLNRILELGSRRLDLPFGFLTQITEDEQTIISSRGDHELLQPGEKCPLEESYCRRTIEVDELLAVSDTPNEGWEDDPAYEVFELGCYIGGKVITNDELYGTLCFASDQPRNRDFTDGERTFVELASRWVSYEIGQREYREELEQQNQRLEEFASIVSHDLRNPLNAATTHLELVQAEYDSEHFERIERSHNRIEAIITDLLTLARQGDTALDITAVSLPSVLEQCQETGETGTLTLVADTEREIYADRQRLQRLFENLIRNAVEHGVGPAESQQPTAESSDSHTGTDCTDQADSAVTVTVGNLPDGFYLEDDGQGIPPDERNDVLDAGYSTSTEGTGFGLYIVETIVDAHDWDLKITAGADGGARFEITGVEHANPWQT